MNAATRIVKLLIGSVLLALSSSAAATEPPDGDTRSIDGFSSTDLIKTGFEGMLSGDCLLYCVTGWRARLVIRLTDTYVSIQPRIQHNLPDTLIQVYPHADGTQPWQEWAALMAKPQSVVGSAGTNIWFPLTQVSWLGIGNVSGGLLGGGVPNGAGLTLPGFEALIGGGESKQSQQNSEGEILVKDADVIGHPMSLLPELINDSGDSHIGELGSQSYIDPTCTGRAESEGQCTRVQQCSTPNCLELQGGTRNNAIAGQVADNAPTCTSTPVGREGEKVVCEDPAWHDLSLSELGEAGWGRVEHFIAEYQDRFDYYKDNPHSLVTLFYGAEIARVMNMVEAIEDIKRAARFLRAIKTYYEIMNTTIRGYTWNLGRLDVDRLMCDTDIYPFFPYNMSTVDAIQWRSGFPITDLHAIGTALNPLDTTGIGAGGSPFGGDYWGPLYPRDNQVENNHDAKVGAVIAARALSAASQGPRGGVFGRIGIALPQGGHRFTARPDRERVQLIYPEDRACRVGFYDPTGDALHENFIRQARDQRYAYNVWRRYQCYTSERGSITLASESWGSDREICIL